MSEISEVSLVTPEPARQTAASAELVREQKAACEVWKKLCQLSKQREERYRRERDEARQEAARLRAERDAAREWISQNGGPARE